MNDGEPNYLVISNGQPDFKTLFESVPGLYLVLTPRFTIIAASDAYLAATMTQRSEILGRSIFEVFPDNPNDPAATGVRNLRASLEQVLRDRTSHAMAIQKYAIRRPEIDGGGFEERYWSAVNCPVFEKGREVVTIIHRIEDVTRFVRQQQKETEQAKSLQELQSRGETLQSEVLLRDQELQDVNRRLLKVNDQLRQAQEELETRVHERTADVMRVNETLQGEVLERKRIEQTLRDEREQWRVTLESIGDAVIVTDATGRVTLLNPIAQSLTGWTEHEATGRSLYDLFTIVNEETRKPVENPVMQAVNEGVIVSLANHSVLIGRDGSGTPIDDSAAPIRDSNGRVVGGVLVFRDITDRKRSQKALAERVHLLSMGADVGAALTQSATLREMLQRCSQALVEHLGGAFARIWTLNSSDHVLELQASAGLYTRLDGSHHRIPVGKFKIGLIAQERKPHLTNAVIGDPRVNDQDWAVREGMIAFAGYPLVVDDRLVGVMAMFSRQPLSDATLAAMASVANEIALGTERKQAEARLRDQREWLRVTLASIGDGVITTDTEGRVTFLNAVAEDLTGWTETAAKGQRLEKIFPIYHEESRQPVENPVAKVIREGVVVGLGNHTILIARNGTERPIDDSAAPIKDAIGSTLGAVLIFRDVTEQRHSEMVVRESVARKTAILEMALDCIITMDHQGRVVEFNPAAEKTFGYDRTQVIGKELASLIVPPSLRERHKLGLARYLATDEGSVLNKRIEMPALHANGTEFPVELAITRISTDRPPMFTAYLRDISEKNRQDCHRILRLAISQLLMRNEPIAEVARGVLQTVCEILKWELGFFWALDPNADTLRCLESWHVPELGSTRFETTRRQHRFGRGQGLPGQVWNSAKFSSVLKFDPGDDFPGFVGAAQEGLHSSFAHPIAAGSEILGVIEFFSVRNREPDPEVLEIMGVVGELIGQCLERKQAEEKRDRFFVVGTDMLVIVGFDGDVKWVNPAWKNVLGWAPVELTGRPWLNLVHPDDQAATEAVSPRLLREGETVSFENRYRHKEGGYRWINWKVKPYREEQMLYGGATDITERKRAEAALRESEEKLRLLADTIPQLAWMAQPDGYIFWYNQRWYEYTGTTPEQMEGWGWQSVHNPETLPGVLNRWTASISSGESFEMVFPLKGADQRFRPFLTRVNPLRDDEGRILYWFGTNTDISEIKEMEEALRESDRRKDEFLATLAHELRNPLAPIRNSLQIMSMPKVDAAIIERAREMMERQVHHLVRLVDDLLDVSRVMRGKIELRKEQINLSTVVVRALETAQTVIDAQKHELIIALAPEPLTMEVDPVRIAQVVGNLLTNAAKYTDPGGRIWVTSGQEGEEAVVRVRDSGIGIAAQMQPLIFDLFVQVDHGATRSQGGLGVGLTLVKSLVEMHHGKIEVRSEGLNKGSEFVVRLPLAAKDREASPKKVVTEQEKDVSFRRLRVLVVDDNRDAAETLSMFLNLLGHEVRVAFDGKTALEAAGKFGPELAILDIGMPVMNGHELARELRQLPGLEKIKLVALTGWGQEQDRRRTQEAGFDHHLTKPASAVSLEKLLADVSRA